MPTPRDSSPSCTDGNSPTPSSSPQTPAQADRPPTNMRIAIVHYWLVGMRGGEKVIEALCRMYPQADIFTHVVAPERLSSMLAARHIRTSFIQRLPGSVRHYQKYLPLMPLVLEQFDLRDYDLVISSESGPAKGVLTRADTAHVCYCHSPMRYLWDFQQDYLDNASPLMRPFMRIFFHYLRQWDVASSQRVDRFVANSRNVARRITKHWRREATVVHPPVECDLFTQAPDVADLPDDEVADIVRQGGYYLCLGQLVGYKRVDIAIEACRKAGRRLVVVGDGEQRAMLERNAPEGVTFLGWRTQDEIRALYAGCRALLFPGEEDFGIVPVECMASGRPVIAYGKGGALETVLDGETGVLFHEQTATACHDAIMRHERMERDFVPDSLRRHARTFDTSVFERKFRREVEAALHAVRG